MTTTPDPKTVREIAREHVRSGRAYIGDTISRYFNGMLREDEFAVWEYEVTGAWRVALGTLHWPDEQLQDERDMCTCGESKTVCQLRTEVDQLRGQLKNEREATQGERDGYAVRLLDMLEADPDRFQESEEEDLRAALSTLFRHAAEAANLATALSEARAERDGATQAVADAVSILEGMLNEDEWAYDAGRARNVLLDYFARDLDALGACDAKASGQR